MTVPFAKRQSKWAWRDYLTAEELELVRQADEAKRAWRMLRKDLVFIQNRAIQRARYAAGVR